MRTRILIGMVFVAMVFAGGGCGKKKTTTPETSAGAAEAAQAGGKLGEDLGGEGLGKLDGSSLRTIRFDFDSSEISSEARDLLQNNAEYMKKHANAKVVIEGNCDERGTNAYNLALGERRAGAAKKYLVNMGVSAKRLKTKSFGEERPVDLGHSEEAWRKNRRAEFVEK